MSAAVTVVDAGVGNLGNLARAVAHLGGAVEITRDPGRVAAARCLLLPGVGAFAPPREALRGPLETALAAALAAGAGPLGICAALHPPFGAGEGVGGPAGPGPVPGRGTPPPPAGPAPPTSRHAP